MSKKDKIIFDLKKRNDSLLYQYDMTRIRELHYSLKCESLKRQNTKLKKELENMTFNFQCLSSACGSLAEFMGLDKDSTIDEMIDYVVKYKKED